MNFKPKDWHTPYLNKRPATYTDILKVFPRADRHTLQDLLRDNLLQDALAWNKQQLQYIDALSWQTIDFKPKLLAVVFAYGYMKGQQAAAEQRNG